MVGPVLQTMELQWLTTVVLLSLRLGAIFLMTPLLAPGAVPARVRVLIVFGLAAALSLGLPPETRSYAATLNAHPGLLVQAGCTELALGTTLGAGILVAMAAFSVAGRLLDVQVGFGMGQALDPISNTHVPPIATLFNQVAVVMFFLVNGHHVLMRGIAFSLERVPLGRPWALGAAAGPLIKEAAGLFGLAFSLAAPVIFCILLVEMALGVLARNLPQINMLILGIPVKVVVGLVTLALGFQAAGPAMNRIYGSIYQTWGEILSADGLYPEGAP